MRFPKLGRPSSHPCTNRIFHEIYHPAIGVARFQETPSRLESGDLQATEEGVATSERCDGKTAGFHTLNTQNLYM